nr:immunoglobulin heavy chain junction region [Mus musculus]
CARRPDYYGSSYGAMDYW